jgi:hypothetical protein
VASDLLQIQDSIPRELGLALSCQEHLDPSCLMSMRGSFLLAGTRITVLQDKLYVNKEMQRETGFNSVQMQVFRCVQKSMNMSKKMKSMDDVIKYMAKYR